MAVGRRGKKVQRKVFFVLDGMALTPPLKGTAIKKKKKILKKFFFLNSLVAKPVCILYSA